MSTALGRGESSERAPLTIISNAVSIQGGAIAEVREAVEAPIALNEVRASEDSAQIWTAPAEQVSVDRVAARAAILDAGTIAGTALLAKFVYLDAYLGLDQSTMPYLLLGVVLAAVLHQFYNELGLYEPQALRSSSISFGKLFGGLALSFLVLLGGLYLLKLAEALSRGWMLTWFVASVLLVSLGRIAIVQYVKSLVAEGRMKDRVAIFGAYDFCRRIQEQLSASSDYEVVGVYCDDIDNTGHGFRQRYDVDGGLHKLVTAARSGMFRQVLIAFPATETKRIKETVRQLALLPTELQLCTGLAANPVAVHKSSNVGDVRVDLVMPRPSAERDKFLKSGLDYILAAVLIVLLSPVMLLVALAIKLDSRGPVFFRQQRFGYNQRIFSVFKFRTMRTLEDGADVVQAQQNDARVTRVGRFLRRTSLDELPQLLNVLKGEMSIVGPRPHALLHNQQFASVLEHYPWRHRVKPGITGWAQVNGYRGETRTREQLERRIQFDLYYIDNWSIWLDLEILVRTVFAVVTGRGAY